MPQAVVAVQSFIYGAVGTAAAAAGASSATAAAIANTAVIVATEAARIAILAGINAAVANQNKPRDQGGLINLTINPNEPRRLQIGKRLNGGVLVDWYVKGSKNNNLFMIIYLGEGPMGQVSRVFAGGRVVHGTPLVHATRTAIPGFRSTEGGEGGNRLWITYYDGRPGQAADATLVAESVGWTTNHIGTGCAYAIVECLWDSDNLRSPPQLGFELEGAKFYDRRLDTTAGGSGSHRADNPATWALSGNPAVALDHYLLGRYLSSVKTFGVGLDAEDVPYARFASLANLCDENVDLKAGGTQKRYRANGFLFADRSYADTIKDLCRAMNARPADFGGRIGVIDSEERTPVMTLSDGDVIESAAEQYSPKRSWGELVSVVRGTFQDPLQNYQSAEYPRVTDATWVTEDGGSPKEATLDFEMETSAERAQRLAYLYAVRERRQAQLTGTYGLRAIELEQGDWFIRSGGIFGTSPGKVFEVIDRALDVASMTVTLTAFEVDPADSAWDENIAADPLPAPISSDDLLQAMEVPALTVTGITLTGTAAQLPAIRVQWTAPTDPRALQILVEAVPTAGGVPTSAVVDVGTGEVTFTSGITDDTNYLVRARFIGTFTPSAWTSTYAVTTLGDYSVGEASSVPWSGVTGAGKPDDNADVTGDNTAAAITGQGALATESSADYRTQIDNVPPDTANLILTQDFANGAGSWASAASDVVTVTGQEFTHALRLVSGGSGIQYENNFKPCRPGEKIFYRAMVNTSGAATGARIGIHITDSAGGNAQFIITNVAGGTAWTLFSGLATAGANARRFRMFIFRQVGAASTETPLLAQPFKARYTPGADPTIDNTAAAITGQGALATKGSVDLATSEVTNKTASNIVYSGAVSIESLKPGEVGANVTESRTAAAITGQGWGATASEAAASNANIPANNVNRVPRALFENGRNDWFSYTNGPAVAYDGPLNFAGKRYLSFNAAATGSGQIIGTFGQFYRCSPGERLSASAILQSYGTSTIDFTWLTIQFFDASEAWITQSDAQVITGPALGFPVTRGGFVTAPAGAAFCRMFAYCRSTTSGQLHLDLAEPMIAGAHPLQAVLPAFNNPINAQDNADVTSTNTAAAITGQGWGATAAEAAASNVLVGAGSNSLADTGFWQPSGFWVQDAQSGTNAASVSTRTSGLRVRAGVGAGVTVGHWIRMRTLKGIPCKPGDKLGVRALIGASNASSIRCTLRFRTAAGGNVSEINTNLSTGILPGTGEASTFNELSSVGTAPASAEAAHIEVWAFASTSAPILRFALPTIAFIPSGQTVAPPLHLGFDAAPGADPTNANTAAAITGQGSQATANHQRGSTYSGTPTEGSWWSDTSTNQLKLYTGGAWQIVATIGNQNITITRTNGFVKTRIGNGTNTTNSVSFSATGGSGAGYTFAHELFVTYTSGPSATISSSSGTPITASATGVVGDEVRGFVQTTCTDSAGNKSTLVSPLALFWEL